MKEPATAADDAGGKDPRQLKLQARALLALAVCAVTALLYVCHEVFVPVALALLFALVLSSAVEALHRRGLPRSLGAVLMLLVLLTTVLVLVTPWCLCNNNLFVSLHWMMLWFPSSWH